MGRFKMEGLAALTLALLLAAGCAPAADVPSALPEPQVSAALQPTPTPEPVPTPTPELPEPTVASLAVCGDVMSHLPLTEDAWDEAAGRYDYQRVMKAAQPWVAAADYAVANFETTMAGGPPYSGYPAFNSPDDLAYDLKALGFDLVLTANNHSLDRGWSGVQRTLDVLDEAGLAHVGTSRTQEEADHNIVVADVGGISVAFLGWTYGTNGIPLPKDAPFAVNVYNVDYLTHLAQPDYDRLGAALEQARALESDLIAVMIHWGVEYQTTQNHYQEEVADFLIAHGADLVLGGHSHVPQPIQIRTAAAEDGTERTGFVCYSLGNFISAQNDPLTDTTAVLTLELTRDNVTGKTAVTGCDYAPMLMLDREEGAAPRFELLDAAAVADDPDQDEGLRARAVQAMADCQAILGDPEAITASLTLP